MVYLFSIIIIIMIIIIIVVVILIIFIIVIVIVFVNIIVIVIMLMLELTHLTAQASVSRQPEAKPWYAQSKKGKRFPSRHMSATFSHWSRVRSTPVGL